MTKRYDFRFPPEVGEALDMVGNRNRTGWTGAAIMGTIAMARAAAEVLHASGDFYDDTQESLTAVLFSLAEGFAAQYPGHSPLTMLAGGGPVADGREKLGLLAKFRDFDPLTSSEVSAVLVMAWVRNVDPGLFSRMAAGDG